MTNRWLSGREVARYVETCPGELCDLVLELREFVREAAPELAETVAFNALCYYNPDRPYGVIGGNVCMIGTKPDCVHLAFLHGAHLDDPARVLDGNGKSKRYIALRDPGDIRREALTALIRAAIAHTPGA